MRLETWIGARGDEERLDLFFVWRAPEGRWGPPARRRRRRWTLAAEENLRWRRPPCSARRRRRRRSGGLCGRLLVDPPPPQTANPRPRLRRGPANSVTCRASKHVRSVEQASRDAGGPGWRPASLGRRVGSDAVATGG